MYQTLKVFSNNYVFQNPVTQEYASLFIHNIMAVIVTNETSITTNANAAGKILNQLGFTNRIYNGHGDIQDLT